MPRSSKFRIVLNVTWATDVGVLPNIISGVECFLIKAPEVYETEITERKEGSVYGHDIALHYYGYDGEKNTLSVGFQEIGIGDGKPSYEEVLGCLTRKMKDASAEPES